MTQERNIYLRDFYHGCEKLIAAEMHITPSRLTRIIGGEPVRTFVRFIRGVRRVLPETADRLVALALAQIREDAEAMKEVEEFDECAAVSRLSVLQAQAIGKLLDGQINDEDESALVDLALYIDAQLDLIRAARSTPTPAAIRLAGIQPDGMSAAKARRSRA